MLFTVTYDSNGATRGAAPVDSTGYVSGDMVTTLANTGELTKRGATFGYWNTVPDGTGTDLDPGNTFPNTGNVTLYAQWFITDGLTGNGRTIHFNFSYHERLTTTAANPVGPEPARTNAVIAACEDDYNRMSGWFASNAVTGMKVQVTPCSNGPYWFGSASSATLRLKPAGAGHCMSPVYLRYLLIAEVTEIFMSCQSAGRFPDSDEVSESECLSQFLTAVSWTSAGPSICHFARTMAKPSLAEPYPSQLSGTTHKP
jgi:Listeria-Bacteroides repeat domain (List_Bact_rpt)